MDYILNYSEEFFRQINQSGTSVAAAHVAESSAMLLSWHLNIGSLGWRENINAGDIKTILIRGADRDSFRTYPNPEWGYGKLDLYHSFQLITIS